MDRSDLESDRRLRHPLARLHQLLCHAHGRALAGDGHDEIRRHHPQIRQAACVDRARERRRDGARGPAILEKAAAHLRQFHVRSVSGRGERSFHQARLARDGAGALAFVSSAYQAARAHAGDLSRPEFPVLPNVWLGTSVESEDYLDRIDMLRRVPARVRFVSFEPLFGPIIDPDLSGIHWAIVGGESGRAHGLCKNGGWSNCTRPANGRMWRFFSNSGVGSGRKKQAACSRSGLGTDTRSSRRLHKAASFF